MTSVLVTGASGFVGRYLCARLAHDGHEVFTYSLRYQQDVRDYEQLRAFVGMVQPEEIHHLAAQAFVPETSTNPMRGYQINLMGTLHLLEAVRQTGLRSRIHVAGTSEEYGYHPDVAKVDESCLPRPTTPYGASKLAATQLAMTYQRMYGMPIVVTRAWNHTGPSQPSTYAIPSFARRIAQIEAGRETVLRHGNLQAVRNYTDVRDIIDAYRLAIQLDPGVYNVANPDGTDCMESILSTLASMSSAKIELEFDRHLYRPGMSVGTESFPEPGCELFRSATGWAPQYNKTTMLADLLDYWREQL